MNLFLRIILFCTCFGFTLYSHWSSHPLPFLREVGSYSVMFWAFCETLAPNGLFNAAIRRLPGLRWLTLGVLGFFVTSCGTGTILKFGERGIEVIPPAGPIVIPTK